MWREESERVCPLTASAGELSVSYVFHLILRSIRQERTRAFRRSSWEQPIFCVISAHGSTAQARSFRSRVHSREW